VNYQTTTYTAQIFCGLRLRYDGPTYSHATAEKIVKDFCYKHDIGVTYTPTKFFYRDQEEPGFIVSFINYPPQPLGASVLERHAKQLATMLKDRLNQKRVCIVFPDHTVVMEEKDDEDEDE
jgi:hypothetical protein